MCLFEQRKLILGHSEKLWIVLLLISFSQVVSATFKSLSSLMVSSSCFTQLMVAEEQYVSVVLELCSRCPSFLLLQPWRGVSSGNRKQMIGFRVWMSGRHSTWASRLCAVLKDLCCLWLLSRTQLKRCEESVKQYWIFSYGRRRSLFWSVTLLGVLSLSDMFLMVLWWFRAKILSGKKKKGMLCLSFCQEAFVTQICLHSSVELCMLMGLEISIGMFGVVC